MTYSDLRAGVFGNSGAVPPPVSTVAPSITGTPAEGQTLTGVHGTYVPTAASYTYRWLRGGVAIGGATSQTYLLVSADVGSTIVFEETPTGAGGTGAAATSSATAAVTGLYLFRDTFTGADGTALTAHTPDFGGSYTALQGTFKILSNKAVPNSNANEDTTNADCGRADYVITADLTFAVTDASNYEGPALLARAADSANYWMAAYDLATMYILEKTAGSYTSRASSPYTRTSPTKTTMLCSGPNIAVYANGQLCGNYAGATAGQTVTKVGIYNGVVGTPPGLGTLDDLTVYAATPTIGTVSGDGYVMFAPIGASTSAPLPLVMLHHGSGENHLCVIGSTFTPYRTKEPAILGLVNAGFAVVSSNAAGKNWGNAAGLTATKALYDSLVGDGWQFTKVIHVGQSMGGLIGQLALSDAANWPTSVGFYGTIPVCSLSNMYGGGAGLLFAEIETAYGFSGSSNYAAATAGHDPILLSASLFAGKRMRWVASPDDTIVSKSANADAMSSHVSATATESAVVACTGDHGDESAWIAADLLAFCRRC